MSDITDINDLLKAFDNPNHCYPQRLVDAIRLLVKERDDARRMYCEAVNRHHVRLDAFGIAKNHGWDCYEKDNEKS